VSLKDEKGKQRSSGKGGQSEEPDIR